MKRLLLFLLCQGSIAGYSQDTLTGYHYTELSDSQKKLFDAWHEAAPKPDTLCEWMHISTRPKGFVISQMAKAVQVNGICVMHLDGHGKPFPVHYRVGWCEGKERVIEWLTGLLNERRGR